MTKLFQNWEVGSDFHWLGVPQGPFLNWPETHRMFASGREALLGIWSCIGDNNVRSLFVPEYFCNEVETWWQNKGIKIRRYKDSPHMDSPEWDTLSVSKGDAVLAVNYFGVRDGNLWSEWRSVNNEVLMIEDHSHDPFSGWALGSNADFVFASLRKTFPAPDGAILWSPKNLRLPDEPTFGDWTGSALKLAAMVIKRDYISGDNNQVKESFLDFQSKGEQTFNESETAAVSPWSRYLITSGYPIAWRAKREENVKIFLDLISASSLIQPLFTKWPDRSCPFNAVLLFPSKQDRDKYRSQLILAGVYPPVHWELNDYASPDVLAISNRILTIPMDQRYNREDINRIVSIIFSVNKNVH